MVIVTKSITIRVPVKAAKETQKFLKSISVLNLDIRTVDAKNYYDLTKHNADKGLDGFGETYCNLEMFYISCCVTDEQLEKIIAFLDELHYVTHLRIG